MSKLLSKLIVILLVTLSVFGYEKCPDCGSKSKCYAQCSCTDTQTSTNWWGCKSAVTSDYGTGYCPVYWSKYDLCYACTNCVKY